MRRIFARPQWNTRPLRVAGIFVLALGVALVANAATPRAACACTPKAKAYLASMKADLRILITAQEDFFADSGRFAASLSELDSVRYRLSYGVELVSLKARADGFDARVSRPTGISQQCWISATIGADGLLNLADPQCDPWPSALFPAPRDMFTVYTAGAYAGLWLLALVVRILRAGKSLPPFRRRTIAGFLSLAVLHPYSLSPRIVNGCNGIVPSLELLWVPLMAGIAVWMLARGRRRTMAVLFLAAGLATLAAPRALDAQGTAKRSIAAMKADLRNLVSAQEAFFTDSSRYAASLDALGDRYALSSGVTLESLAVAPRGFRATMLHDRTPVKCAIAVGEFTNSAVGESEGEPICDDPPVTYGPLRWAIAYVALFLLAVGIRGARAGVTLPPIRGQTIFGFALLAVVHPFWPWLQDDSGGCLGYGDGPAVMAVTFISYIVVRMALRGTGPEEPPRPA